MRLRAAYRIIGVGLLLALVRAIYYLVRRRKSASLANRIQCCIGACHEDGVHVHESKHYCRKHLERAVESGGD